MQPVTSPSPYVILVQIQQQPQMELQVFVQLFGQLGFTPEKPKAGAPASKWRLTSADEGLVEISLIPEIGMFRLVLHGAAARTGGEALSNYLPVLNFDVTVPQLDQATTLADRRLFAMLAVLLLPDGDTAMERIGTSLLDEGPDEVREGVVSGLTILETSDVGRHLEAIARAYPDSRVGEMASKSLEVLVEQGIVTKSVDTLLDQAEELVASDPAGALELLDEARAAGHDSQRARVIEARAHRGLGALEDAELCLAPLEVGEYQVQALVERASVREQLDHLQGALEDARAALAIDPEDAAASALQERLMLALEPSGGSSEDKMARLNAAIESRPGDAGLRMQRAEAALALGDYRAALDDLERAQEKDAANGRIPVLKAEAELGAKRFGSALRSATLAGAGAPSQLKRGASALRGRVYLALDEPLRALGAFAEGRRTEPDFGELWLGLGLAQELAGRSEDATKAYGEALARCPASELVSRLKPITYEATPLWSEVAGQPLAPGTRPERKLGDEPSDALFKRCLGCGSVTIGRRTSCKECGEKEFLK